MSTIARCPHYTSETRCCHGPKIVHSDKHAAVNMSQVVPLRASFIICGKSVHMCGVSTNKGCPQGGVSKQNKRSIGGHCRCTCTLFPHRNTTFLFHSFSIMYRKTDKNVTWWGDGEVQKLGFLIPPQRMYGTR